MFWGETAQQKYRFIKKLALFSSHTKWTLEPCEENKKNFAKEKGEVGTTFEKGSPKIAVAKKKCRTEGRALKLVKYPDKSGIIKAFESTTCCNDPTRH